MKLFITILILLAIASCYIEKRIQVKTLVLKVKLTEAAHRLDRDYYHVVWTDDEGVEYDMFCTCPQYKVGDTQIFLITR